jgi:hypothetical protein
VRFALWLLLGSKNGVRTFEEENASKKEKTHIVGKRSSFYQGVGANFVEY